MAFKPSPPPTGHDPHGLAVGALANEELTRRGLKLTQWRWEYGTLADRQSPFDDHVALDGRFMTLDGMLQGFFPGDHRGCLCAVEPVYKRERTGERTGRITR